MFLITMAVGMISSSASGVARTPGLADTGFMLIADMLPIGLGGAMEPAGDKLVPVRLIEVEESENGPKMEAESKLLVVLVDCGLEG